MLLQTCVHLRDARALLLSVTCPFPCFFNHGMCPFPCPDSLSTSPAVLLAGSISTPPASSTTGSAAPQNEELVKAIDQRLLDLGHKIERSLERSMEEQSFRAQMQQAAAVQAAAAMQQQHHMLMRSSAPSQSFTGFGNLPTTAVLEGPAVAPVAMTPSGGGSTGAHGAEASPLVLLAMNKADAAEKLSTEVSKELQATQKAAAKEAEDLFKRLAGLQVMLTSGDAARLRCCTELTSQLYLGCRQERKAAVALVRFPSEKETARFRGC